MRKVIFILLLIFKVHTIIGQVTTQEDIGQKAIDAYHSNNFSECVTLMNEILKDQPLPENYHTRASCYIGMGKINKALNDLDACLAMNKENIDCILLKGHLFIEKEKNIEFIQSDLKKVLSKDSLNPDAYFLLGKIYTLNDQISEAISSFLKAKNAIQHKQPVFFEIFELYKIISRLYVEVEDFPKAIEYSTKALENYKPDKESIDELYRIRSEAFFEQELYDLAIQDYNTYLSEVNPKGYWALYRRALSNYYKKDFSKSLTDLNRLIDEIGETDSYNFHLRGRVKLEIKEYKSAIEDLKKAAGFKYSNYYVYFHLGEAYFLNGEFVNAINSLNKLLKKYPDFQDGYFLRGKAYLKIEDVKNACLDFKKSEALGGSIESKFKINCK
ncbi:MAG: tetratricopeptide repeat protein [Bacteroidetes bacterium]|nr:tetratricopeptide repeat protein [Bacteroidota bacterium]